MPVTFDPQKSAWNAAQRELPFEIAARFNFEAAIVNEDLRRPYPGRRFQALGMIDTMLCPMVFTPTPDGFRVISLRQASRKERRRRSANYDGT